MTSIQGCAGIRSRRCNQIDTPVCVLVMQDTGRFNGLIGKHQIISMDWSDDEDRLIEAYTASDFFVMPSTAKRSG